ncbi:MAG: hypothetical protein K6T85_17115 [Gorillibacterium sp.]|nr:hypothetical protein [Gorillibacterium sp.]
MDSEKSEMNGLERFLIWFLVPVVFGVVLLSVLFYLLEVDVKEPFRRLGNEIPIVRNWVPNEPIRTATGNTDAEGSGQTSGSTTADLAAKDKEIAELKAKAKEDSSDVTQYQNSFLQKDQEKKDLQALYDKLEQDYKKMEQSDETYEKSVTATSKIYAEMTPGKAAPILEKMTVAEQLLILSSMQTENQTKILEKMDVQAAADVSVLLKDVVPSRDRELAALQARIKELTKSAKTTTTTTFTLDELSTSIAGMAPKQAAELLLEMYKTNQAKVIAILKAADSSARSDILGALTTADKVKAAAISSKLTP